MMRCLGYAVLIGCGVVRLAAADSPIPVPDESLDTNALVAGGVPSPDRSWAPQDYGVAVEALTAMAARQVSSLPRHGSSRSGPVFARLIARDNYSVIRDARFPLDQRVPLTIGWMQAVQKAMLLYASRSTPTGTFDHEVAEILAFQLGMMPDVFATLDEFRASLPADDPKREVRLKGLKVLQGGSAGMVNGALTMLTEAQLYRVEPRRRLAVAVESTIASFWPYVPETFQIELPALIGRTSSQVDDVEIKATLTRIRAVIDAKATEK